MENVGKHRDMKVVITNKNLEPNYHTKKLFSDNLLAIEMKKRKVKIKEPVHSGLSMLGNSKTLMYEFLYDHVKPGIKITVNCATKIHSVSLFILKLFY